MNETRSSREDHSLESRWRLITAAVALFSPVIAQAQQASASETSADSAIEEIVVTATRRDERLIDVPMSITALRGADLELKQQDDLSDFLRQVPGVNFESSGTLQTISIRGVSGGGGQRAKAPVSFYIDDAPVVSDPVASPDVKTFDIERIEVLRGPQGTLFGESAIGGVIRVISKQPSLTETEFRTRVSYVDQTEGGTGGTVDAAINLPIIDDKLAVRASFSNRNEPGFIDNTAPGQEKEDANDLDAWNSRIKVLYQATDDLSFSAMGFVSRSDYGSRNQADDNYEQRIFVDETRNDDIDQLNFTIKYDLGAAELTSSTNYFDRDTNRLFDLTPFGFGQFFAGELIGLGELPPDYVNERAWQTLIINDKNFVQEVRLVSSGADRFRWTGGVYYFDTDNHVEAGFYFDPSIDPFNLGLLVRTEEYQQFALYGETEYDFNDRWTLVTGLRWTQENKVINYNQSDDWPGDLRVISPPVVIDVPLEYKITTPKVTLRYQPKDNSTMWFTAARGFRGPSGNVDYNIFADEGAGVTNTVGAETVWTYEFGSKAYYFDNRLFLEAAIFYTDWKDRQEVVNPEAPISEQYADNIGTAKIQGIELSTTYDFTEHLRGGLTATYIDTEITSSPRKEFEGLSLTNEPELRGAASLDYARPIGTNWTLVGHVDATYVDESITSLTSGSIQPSYHLVNLSVGLRSEKWGLSLFGRNITNELIRFGAGQNTSINDPRVIGISVEYTM